MHSNYYVYHIYILLYFQDVLLQLPHRYGHYTVQNAKRWKLYIAKQHHPFENSTNNWGYPFLDICFYSYKRKGMVIQDIDPGISNSRYKVQNVFPVTQRPFYHLSLAVPHDTLAVLNGQYKIKKCASHIWDHKLRKLTRNHASVFCTELHPYFPFVSHAEIKTGHREYLMMDSKVINSFEPRT